MDYEVRGQSPNVAAGQVEHQLDGNGNAFPLAPITWTKTVVALDGSSDTLLAANPLRKGLIIANPVGNAQISYDLASGTVTLANGIPLTAGNKDKYVGPECPTSKITVIGTNAQSVVVYEGT